MLQKESKKATKRRKTTASPKKIKTEGTSIVVPEAQSFAVDPRLQQTPSARPAGRSKVAIGRILQPDDDSDFESSPVRQHA